MVMWIIFIHQTTWFIVNGKENCVYKLHKSLYRLMQSACCFALLVKTLTYLNILKIKVQFQASADVADIEQVQAAIISPQTWIDLMKSKLIQSAHSIDLEWHPDLDFVWWNICYKEFILILETVTQEAVTIFSSRNPFIPIKLFSHNKFKEKKVSRPMNSKLVVNFTSSHWLLINLSPNYCWKLLALG